MKLFNAGKNGASFKVEMGSCLDWGSKFVRNTTNEKCKEMIYFPAAAIGDTGKTFEILEKEIELRFIEDRGTDKSGEADAHPHHCAGDDAPAPCVNPQRVDDYCEHERSDQCGDEREHVHRRVAVEVFRLLVDHL